jgi:lipopolysaccharide transport system permease protein
VVLGGQPPDVAGLAIYTLAGLVFAWLAHRLFERVRPAFADEV